MNQAQSGRISGGVIGTASVSPKMPATEVSMDQLDKNIGYLTETVGTLLQKLEHVSNFGPFTERNASKSLAVCGLSGRIDNLADRVALLNMSLNDQIAALEI